MTNFQFSKMFQLELLLFVSFSCLSLVLAEEHGNVPCPDVDIIEDSNPQQIHLSLGRKATEIVVTWTTFNADDTSFVWYSENWDDGYETVEGISERYVAAAGEGSSDEERILYIHRVILTDLKPLTTYYYECGSNGYYSSKQTFKTLSDEPDSSVRMLVFGDLGYYYGTSTSFIQKEVEEGNVDLVFHNGDIAYYVENCNSKKTCAFMNQIEPIASRVPYQTSPGNHESEYLQANYSNYRARFSMYNMLEPSENRADHYYAFYLGPALIISISTDIYIFDDDFFTPSHAKWQNDWIESVLSEASKPENRVKHPWIIVFGHRPLYCTSDRRWDDCFKEAEKLRQNLEEMFQKYAVDLVIVGHEHTYERTWPVYQSEVYNGSESEPYTNPKAPVYIVSGAAGMHSGLNELDPEQPEWDAYRQNEAFGYGIMELVNSTHLIWKQKDTSGRMKGYVSDIFTLIKDSY